MPSYRIRTATPEDADAARVVMLDTVYHDFRSGYVPRWHGDIIDIEAAYLVPPRHTLLVAVEEGGVGGAAGEAGSGGTVVATAALDSRGPAYPPNPRWLAERYPSGETAQLRRVYVHPGHRRRGLARALVRELLDFAAADGGYRSVYLHTDPSVTGAEPFWRSLGKVVCDERDAAEVAAGDPAGTVHFELPVPLGIPGPR
ncbi:GNAT family N-acetyltransferase [Streptomyces sp. NPDC056987]|uniref:GNAT family N-acetyltransferase n=1 Tax=Streptomyces sp. NPDC056987 TaxID=3345988 RepID=UPI00363140C6